MLDSFGNPRGIDCEGFRRHIDAIMDQKLGADKFKSTSSDTGLVALVGNMQID